MNCGKGRGGERQRNEASYRDQCTETKEIRRGLNGFWKTRGFKGVMRVNRKILCCKRMVDGIVCIYIQTANS